MMGWAYIGYGFQLPQDPLAPIVESPFYRAIRRGDTVKVKAMLDKGEDPRRNEPSLGTPLRYAVEYRRLQVAKILINKLRKAKQVNGADRLALHHAVKKHDAAMVSLLLSNGFAIDAKDSTGATPLLYAAYSGDCKLVKILLNHRADPNVQDSDYGDTPLIQAVAANRQSCVTLLLAHHADINHANKSGLTPLKINPISYKLSTFKICQGLFSLFFCRCSAACQAY